MSVFLGMGREGHLKQKYREKSFSCDSQSVVPISAAAAPGSLLKMRILGPDPRPRESEILGQGPRPLHVSTPSSRGLCCGVGAEMLPDSTWLLSSSVHVPGSCICKVAPAVKSCAAPGASLYLSKPQVGDVKSEELAIEVGSTPQQLHTLIREPVKMRCLGLYPGYTEPESAFQQVYRPKSSCPESRG